MPNRPPSPHGKDWVALVLAVGFSLAVCLITSAVLIDALRSAGPGLSENATQVLTAAFGGLSGILGGYIGYRAGASQSERQPPSAVSDRAAPQEEF